MWARIKAAIRKWINKKLPEVTPPILKPDPKPQEGTQTPPGVDALPSETIRWIGQANCSGALPTKVLRSASRRGDNVDIDWELHLELGS